MLRKKVLRKVLLPIFAIATLSPAAVIAEDAKAPEPVRQAAQRIFSAGVDSIAKAPIPGLYEVTSGMDILYVSQDGKFAIEGDIFQLEKGKDLTEQKRNHLRSIAIRNIGKEGMITFAPDTPRHTITVFTDVDCSYCRKLHTEVPQLNDAGIAVQYLAFPRAGIPSDTFDTMVSVWCADDRKKAMTDAKRGKAVPAKQCKNPVERHFALGKKIGIRGTPAILLQDGALISGYLPASRLQKILEKTFPSR
uniref:Thiol:disulfide interchange protein n=1 Tax=Candidatus Kentrum sp. MB TaxID=2138164 RepID=A0A450X056_9GAMM|nr:MAG: Thiol:disulfide interchange protein DsbC [Candidatus Kentron sp. MB]VFK32142.1 MAG: Thiol:disulfide interchange protein DsbC [Candidatus Kentron sp. MB]VFK74167.1 MAG: Thiol:disulfide interchange protein DsbC [Candidatus Kentron sp. MB]